ncbi:unnamed protein product [Strongylus vulgaris]|uniref:Uncharacterized protein n=1 Tax=Strongylus vulgaris TaxID=40348 RepID=A0A3P7JBS1_STRVU|nr:unnamed protein product [Strongylus vulgaris]
MNQALLCILLLVMLTSQAAAQWGYGYYGYPMYRPWGYGYGMYRPWGFGGWRRNPIMGALRGALYGGMLGAMMGR